MAAGKYKIFIEQGATYQLFFTLYNDDELWNLTDYTARLQARSSIESAEPIFEATTDDIITLGGALGTFDMVIDATDTSDLPDGHYIYDLEIEAPTGDVWRVLQGNFIISPEVTR
jgi:hypothetical protein